MIDRRNFLKRSGSAALTAAFLRNGTAWAQPGAQNTLTVGKRILDIKGRAATVFGITNQITIQQDN